MNKKNVFFYFVKTTLPLLFFVTIISSLIAFLVIKLNYSFTNLEYYSRSPLNGVIVLIIMMLFYAFIMPSYQLRVLKDKRSSDIYLSLPVNTKNLVWLKILVGIFEISISHIFISFVVFLSVISVFGGMEINLFPNLVHFLWVIPITLLMVLCVFLINTFLYTQGNNDRDGVFIQILGTIALFLISYMPFRLIGAFYEEFNNFDFVKYANSFLSFYALIIPIATYSDSLISGMPVEVTNIDSNMLITRSVFLVVLTASCIFGIFIFYKKYFKAEKVNDISSSWFGYKVSLPLILGCVLFEVTVLLASSDISSILLYILCLVLIIGMYIGFSMLFYFRTYKLPISFLIVSVSVIFGSIILGYVPHWLSLTNPLTYMLLI